MEKKIPTEVIQVEDIEVKFYSWLTQEEEDEALVLETGDSELDAGSNMVKTTWSSALKGRNFRLKSLLISPTFEEVNVMKPSIRDEITKQVIGSVNKKK